MSDNNTPGRLAAARQMAREATPVRQPMGERRRFGTVEQNLAYPPIPGFRLYWFNDTPGRVERAKAAGYEHVMENGKPVSRNVGRGEAGGGMQGYLMKIPVQWYQEDMAANQEVVDRRLQDIKDGRHGANPGQNQYVPGSGITVDSDRR